MLLTAYFAPGVDVTITIFANFRPKTGVFFKNQCYDQIFAQFSFVWVKNADFLAKIFLKSVPW
jgi:hypothetical protein